MGKILDSPKFPVLERTPDFWTTVGAFRMSDWAIFGGLTAGSYPVGYWAGASPSPAFARVSGAMARPSAVAGAAMGALAGFMLAYQNASGRLMGLNENGAEVAKARR